jgi:hypothetical protein
MLNTHNISFYDPYRGRNRSSALKIKKQHILKRTVLQQNQVTPHQSSSRDPYGAKFVRGVFSPCKRFFRISLQVEKHVRRNVNPETVMLKKIIYARGM